MDSESDLTMKENEIEIKALEDSVYHWIDDIVIPLKQGRTITQQKNKGEWVWQDEISFSPVKMYSDHCPLCQLTSEKNKNGGGDCNLCRYGYFHRKFCGSYGSVWSIFCKHPSLNNAQAMVESLLEVLKYLVIQKGDEEALKAYVRAKTAFDEVVDNPQCSKTKKDVGVTFDWNYEEHKKSNTEKKVNLSVEGLKYDTGKQQWYAMPLEILKPLSDVFSAGEKKYATFNCLNPFQKPERRFWDAALRHLEACQIDPLAKDEETGCYHAAQVAFNILMRLYHCTHKEEK